MRLRDVVSFRIETRGECLVAGFLIGVGLVTLGFAIVTALL
jgi:hypothetical protein